MRRKDMKIIILTAIGIIAACGAFTYGALTAPQQQTPVKQQTAVKQDPNSQLDKELETITLVLQSAYPKITTDYTISRGKLYDQGQWYGTTLTYKGTDTFNRDTLRVLMQKKDGIWTLRTTPPELLLSAKKYPDVPKSILQSVNQPVSLPGTADSPTINAGE